MSETKILTQQELDDICRPADPSTKEFVMTQTMYRIKDPKESLKFYTGVLGMTLLDKIDIENAKFTVYFLGYENAVDIPSEGDKRLEWVLSRKGAIELTHNWGTESDPDFKYHNGNTDPRGFGHIGVNVPDVYAACERFEKLCVKFIKKPDEGMMKGIAFISDPDGYWIEILDSNLKLPRVSSN